MKVDAVIWTRSKPPILAKKERKVIHHLQPQGVTAKT